MRVKYLVFGVSRPGACVDVLRRNLGDPSLDSLCSKAGQV